MQKIHMLSSGYLVAGLKLEKRRNHGLSLKLAVQIEKTKPKRMNIPERRRYALRRYPRRE
jgi:hypothetical protein